MNHLIDAALAIAARGWFVFQARYKLLKNGNGISKVAGPARKRTASTGP